MAKILAFAGSARTNSLNKKLLNVAVDCARSLGAEVEVVDFKDLVIPLYDGDLEEESGLPENVRIFKKKLQDADGMLIATPEYNGFITPLLKNVLDWASRKETDDEPPLSAYKGKAAALLAATPGPMSGVRSLPFARLLLSNLGCIVLPRQFGLGTAMKAFDEEGRLVDAKHQAAVEGVVKPLVEFLDR